MQNTNESSGYGYDYNDGGISNQKIALVGLVSHVAELPDERSRKLFLPLIYNKDQHDKTSTIEPLDKIFWSDLFFDFLNRWKIEVVDRPTQFSSDRIIAKGWDYFGIGAAKLHNIGNSPSSAANVDISADLLRCLVPKVRSSGQFQKIADLIFRENNIEDVIQFRIEEDWIYHTENWEGRSGYPEDVYIPGEKIASKAARALNYEPGTRVYITCDEKYIPRPKWDIRRDVKSSSGLDIIFKSDLISDAEYRNFKPIDASLVDFEIVKLCSRFIGNSRSTFANLATFERCVGVYRPNGRDYIYNHVGNEVKIRTDMGTRDHPAEVTQPQGQKINLK